MKLATITTKSGYSWKTEINGTDEEILDYFEGQYFDIGVYPNECLDVVISVEIVP